MIEQIMYFALGVLVAALLGIALLPALWRRAVRLTRARLEATLPLSPEEISAGKDQLRARFAVDLRRTEARVEAAEATVHQAKVEIGEKLALIHARDTSLLERAARIAGLEQELVEAGERIAGLEARKADLTRERDNLLTNLDTARAAAQAQEEEKATLRQLADQRQGIVGALELQVDNLSARLADSTGVSTALRDDAQRKAEDLRNAAHALRERETEVRSLERRLTAAETNAHDKTIALDQVQAERLQLIDNLGHSDRERNHERIERSAAQSAVESLTRRVAELESALAINRTQAQQTIADLTRAADHLREERRVADDEISALRLGKAKLETDLSRLRRQDEQMVDETGMPPVPPSPAPTKPSSGRRRAQPRPT